MRVILKLGHLPIPSYSRYFWWLVFVDQPLFCNRYKATMPPATDGMMVEGEKINQSMNSMIYVMIRVIHIFQFLTAYE